jgi:hypothetical protein
LASIRAAGPLPPSLSGDGLLPFGIFYGTNREAHDFPSVRFVAEQFAGIIPNGLLPIANGNEDDEICIGLAGERRGKIYYWDSQGADSDSDGAGEPHGQAGASLPNTYYIAHSFNDFLSRIERFPGEGEGTRGTR